MALNSRVYERDGRGYLNMYIIFLRHKIREFYQNLFSYLRKNLYN